MSLEQELMRNTEALIALTAAYFSAKAVNQFAINAPDSPFAGVVTVAPSKISKAKVTPAEIEALMEVEVPKPVAAATTSSASSAPAATAASPVVAVTAAPTPTETTKAIEYAEVAAAILATFKVDRTRVIDALSRFGAAKGPQLKPKDYVEFLAMLEDAPA